MPIRQRGSSREALTATPVDLERHARECTICAHPQREEIERDFINWTSTAAITRQYKLGDRRKMVRHAHAFSLLAKRRRNVRAALEKIVEQCGHVKVNAQAVVAAAQALSKINAQGQWVDRTETVNLNELFERMTVEELSEYTLQGTLPAWFTGMTGTQTTEESVGDRQPTGK